MDGASRSIQGWNMRRRESWKAQAGASKVSHRYNFYRDFQAIPGMLDLSPSCRMDGICDDVRHGGRKPEHPGSRIDIISTGISRPSLACSTYRHPAVWMEYATTCAMEGASRSIQGWNMRRHGLYVFGSSLGTVRFPIFIGNRREYVEMLDLPSLML
jgi:hypothetical protein